MMSLDVSAEVAIGHGVRVPDIEHSVRLPPKRLNGPVVADSKSFPVALVVSEPEVRPSAGVVGKTEHPQRHDRY
ncbi:MAG: hypothetical protein JNM43_11425 [Planctomycetaceae bacterium]|nr:hypothetical protein [Planctomycetaceae bacterium]